MISFLRFRTRNALELCRQFGFRAMIDIAFGVLFCRNLFKVKIRGYPHPIFLRWKSSDRLVLEQILYRNESHAIELNSPKQIIDIGANIGLSSVLYSSLYPGANIVAVEPAIDNVVLLRENTKCYNNITVVDKCIWFKDCDLLLENPKGEAYAYQFSDSTDTEVNVEAHLTKAITIQSLLNNFNIETIDLMKIDIEGAEYELFSKGDNSWCQRVKWLLIEPHDRFKPGCTDAICAALMKTHQQRENSGEF